MILSTPTRTLVDRVSQTPVRSLLGRARRAPRRLRQRVLPQHREHPATAEHLKNYRRLVLERRPRRITVLTDAHDLRLTNLVQACRSAFPQVPLLVIRVRRRRVELPPDSEGVRYLQLGGPGGLPRVLWRQPTADVVLDFVGPGAIKARVLGAALLPLADGGLYVLHHLLPQGERATDFDREDLDPLLDEVPERRIAAHRVRARHQSVVIEKRGWHVYKLRDAQLVSSSFLQRLGPDWGTELTRRPAEVFVSRATVELNRPELAIRFKPEMTVRPRFLREYRDVVCGPRQQVLRNDLALPISFHHPGRASQHVNGSVLVDDDIDRLSDYGPVEDLAGTYFHLVSEFPGHFGHFMTEDLGRMWGWFQARRRYPDLKLLVSARGSATELKSFQRVLLRALGVPADDVVVINRPVRVSRLVGASPQFHNRRFVDPEITRVWDRIRDRLQPEPDPEAPRRIFITRPPGGVRQCRNAPELEQWFAEHGFVIVRPETLGLREQVRLFSNADVIAGYGGSGMFGMVYSRRPGRRIVISSDTYTASNEYLIASVKGDDYVHLYCDADLQHPPDGWLNEAFFSSYAFDFDRDGPRLAALLAEAAPAVAFAS